MRFVAGDGGNPLDEVEDVLGLPALLREHCFDDRRRLGFRETTLTEEFSAIVVGARNDLRYAPL